MLESVIYALIYICLLAIVVYLVIWVLTSVVNVPIPPKIIQLIWVIFALVCILILVRLFLGSGAKIFGALLPLLV
jgi:hypothetical protein